MVREDALSPHLASAISYRPPLRSRVSHGEGEDIEEVIGMASAVDEVVEASVRALEFREAAWDADELGAAFPDTSALSDPALLAVLAYERCDLPMVATKAAEMEATHRGLIASALDRWFPVAVLAVLVLSGVAIGLELLMG